MKRVVSIVLAVAMLVGMLPTTAWATEMETVGGTCGENLTWTFDESSGSLKISGTGDMDDYSWSQMYDPTNERSDIWVTNAPWRDYYSAIKSIVIESDVTIIGDGAFRGCVAVTSISLSNDVEVIGEYSFMDCDKITDVVIPENVKTIGEAAFGDCNALEKASILGATSIGNFAFSECASLESIALPGTLTSIGEYAFRGCEALKKVTIPSSVRTIGAFAFVWCESLNEICFEGSAPSMDGTILSGLTCNVSYPSDDETWSEELQKEFDDTISWNGNGSGGETSESSHSHSYGDWYETKAPTQEAEGEERRNCTGCDHYETRVIERLASSGDSHEHIFNSDVKQPTCTEQGYTTYICDCGERYVDDYVDASGHNIQQWIKTENGHSKICENCGESVGIDPHTDSNMDNLCDLCSTVLPLTMVARKEPTCTETGYEEYWYSEITGAKFADANGIELIESPQVIPATGHKMGDWYETKTPTEETEGEERRECEICDYYETRALDKLTSSEDAHEHSYTFAVTASTCTEPGYTTYTCECGDNYTSDYVDAVGHRFGEWYETKAATEDAEGEEQRDCTACEKYEKRIKDKQVSASGTCGDNVVWNLKNGVLMISGNGIMEDYDIFYPYTPWYSYRSSIKKIEISQGVTYIGTYAFARCGNLVDVVIPEGIEEIAYGAFADCTSLKKVIFPDSLAKVREEAFDGCSSLEEVYFGENIMSIGLWAFSQTKWLENLFDEEGFAIADNLLLEYRGEADEVRIPENITIICDFAFSGAGIKNIVLPTSLQYIGQSAFSSCKQLQNIEFPDGLIAIDAAAFEKAGLVSVDWPSHITTICDRMFSGCSSLAEVYLHNQITHIGNNAFYDTSLVDLHIPDSVVSIGECAFASCENLKKVQTGCGLKRIQDRTFYGCNAITTIIIGKNVVDIGNSAFYGCNNLTNVVFEGIVQTIGNSAFQYCMGLSHLDLPTGLTAIGNGAFSYCDLLSELVLPDSLVNIGKAAFSGSGIERITIPKNVSQIQENVFTGCDKLHSVYLHNKVTHIKENAFSGCTNLTNIELPEGLEYIGDEAFSDCDGIKTVSIPNSVVELGSEAYSYCSGLVSLKFGTGLSKVMERTFEYCRELATVIIPITVEEIRPFAFAECTGISTVYFGGSEKVWEDMWDHWIFPQGGNECLTEANVYFNSNGPDNESTNSANVRYFSSWKEEKQIAYFDSNPETDYLNLGSEVTEETDKSFMTNVDDLVGTYVLVETKARADGMIGPDILLSIKPVDTKIGTVTSADENTIVIDGETYNAPNDLMFPDSYVGKTVRYYLYNGELISLEVSQSNDKAYDVVLNEYRDICSMTRDEFNNQYKESDYPYVNQLMMRYYHIYGGMQIVYAFYDIDGNGVDELLIGNGNEDKASIIGLYAFDGEKAVTLNNTAGERQSLKIHTDGTIKIQTSESASNTSTKYYRLDASGSKLTEVSAGSLAEIQNFEWKMFDTFGDADEHPDGGFNESIYRVNYLLDKETDDNLQYYLEYISEHSPTKIILEVKDNTGDDIKSIVELWRTVTLIFDAATLDGSSITEYGFELVHVNEAILLNALGTAVDSDDFILPTMKKVSKNSKKLLKDLQTALKVKENWEISETAELISLSDEQKATVKKNIKAVIKESELSSQLGTLTDTVEMLDDIMDVCLTLEELITKTYEYALLWQLPESMASVLDEMYKQTPNDVDHIDMREALKFCRDSILETSAELFASKVMLKSGFMSGGKYFLKEGVSFMCKSIKETAIKAVPGLNVLLVGYKAGRTISNMFFKTDSIAEQVLKLCVVNEYYNSLYNAIPVLTDKYNSNQTIENADMILNALSLLFALADTDCGVANSYVAVVDEALWTKISEAFGEKSYDSEGTKRYITDMQATFKQQGRNAATYWVFQLKADYPDIYPDYADLVSENSSDNVLVVPITSSYLIECPVNVYVYNMNGDLLVSLCKDNTYSLGEVSAIQIKNRKFIDIYNNTKYQIKCEGYDQGTMDVTIEERNGLDVIRNAAFYDLPVTNSIVYELITKTDPTDNIIHTITSNNESISADFDSNIKADTDVHIHSGGVATCAKKAVCIVCGVCYGELAPHDFASSWSQGNANGHWHECKNCSSHDTQVKHTPGAAATEDTAQFCTVCGYVITPALGHTCTAGTKWYSNGTYHWHLCTSCGAWVKTSYHSYSSGTDETCNVCGYTRTVTATEPTQETEVVMAETTEIIVPDEEVITTDTVPIIVPTETNENLSDNAVSEDTDSHGVSGVLITVFTIVTLGSLAALVILLVYKKRHESE